MTEDKKIPVKISAKASIKTNIQVRAKIKN